MRWSAVAIRLRTCDGSICRMVSNIPVSSRTYLLSDSGVSHHPFVVANVLTVLSVLTATEGARLRPAGAARHPTIDGPGKGLAARPQIGSPRPPIRSQIASLRPMLLLRLRPLVRLRLRPRWGRGGTPAGLLQLRPLIRLRL